MDYNLINTETQATFFYTNAIVSLEGDNIVVYQDQEGGAIMGIFPTSQYFCTYEPPKP
jgi:hypothetical protein